MSTRDWDILPELLERAAVLDGADRARFLDEVCFGDTRKRVLIERLLAADARAGAFLAVPVLRSSESGVSPSMFDSSAGDVVARYTIQRCLGRGGIGTVYAATQEDPQRTIALKLLDPGLASGSALLRFRFEAEVLGRLAHPGIAVVHEAGEDAHGRAYLAMELVENASFVTDYAARERLDTEACLTLFLALCSAVAYAHGQGVIHRDLKPSNVLVDGEGRVKVIDFGIARALDADASRLTREGDVVGTLAYMSPEQVSGRPAHIDAQTDVYALGALLYELLAGRKARDLAGLALPEVLRRIREGAVMPLTSVRPDVPRELEWIATKALAREPARRYGSVEELAADIQRFREHVPLKAGPPTASYRLVKFVRRHRIGVAAASGLALVLVGAVVAIFVAERRAQRLAQRRIAAEQAAVERVHHIERELATNREILGGQTSWLGTELLDKNGHDARVVDVLDAAARELDERCFASHWIEAEARYSLAMAYAATDLGARACAQIELLRAVVARGGELAQHKFDRMERTWCLAASSAGRAEEAIAHALEELQACDSDRGPSDPASIAWRVALGELFHRTRDEVASEAHLRAALSSLTGQEDSAHELVREARGMLAEVLSTNGDHDAALRETDLVVESATRHLGEDHPSTRAARDARAALRARVP